MSSQFKRPENLAEFYTHALGLEHECEQRMDDLSRTLKAHRNPEAAGIFERARKMRTENIRKINSRCAALELPRVAPWEFYWHQHLNLESICTDSVHYLISAIDAIELVLIKLDAASRFYSSIQSESADTDIQQAAAVIREMLAREMETVDAWKEHQDDAALLSDLDPPHQPE